MGQFLDSVPFSGIIRIRDMMYGVKDPFRLDQGDVSFDAPDTVKSAMHRAIDDNRSHYLQTTGLPRLLELLADKLHARNGIPIGAPDEIMVTTGGIHGVFIACQGLLEPGDEVIVPDPEWPPCMGNVRAAHGVPVPCRLHESAGWRFDLAELESKITPRTRAIYVNSPNNPSGGVLTRADVEAIAAIAERRGIWIISDEAYEDVIFDGAEHVSAASLPGMYDRTISIYTFSKTYTMTGLRLGYVAAKDPKLRDRMKKALFYTASNISSVVQYRRRRRARGVAGADRRVPDGTAGPPRSVLRRHSQARGRRLQWRAAKGRVLCLLEDQSRMASAVGNARRVAFLDDGRVPDRPRPHRVRARRRFRGERRGLPPVLLCARSRRTERRPRVHERAVPARGAQREGLKAVSSGRLRSRTGAPAGARGW